MDELYRDPSDDSNIDRNDWGRSMREWHIWRDMILSDQMEVADVIRFLREHPDFAAWYMGALKL